MIIGVSGKSGSGKSCVSRDLANRLNYYWLDVDMLASEVREKYSVEIEKLVGNKIVIDGKIDSKLLGKILFNDKELMKKYNDFLYSKYRLIIKECISKYKNVIIDSLFLEIMEVFKDCDYLILVTCKDSIRKERILNRDQIDDEYFKIREQNSYEYNLSKYDYIINNDRDYKEDLDKIVELVKDTKNFA